MTITTAITTISRSGIVSLPAILVFARAVRISRARVVDAGRMITAGGIASGMELGFQLLWRAGYDQHFISEVPRTMEYSDYRSTAITSTCWSRRRE